MPNRAKGEAGVKIDGKDYVLAFDVNAMCEVEYILNLSADKILRVLDAGKPPIHMVRALLWGGLRRHHSDIDLIGAGSLIEALGGTGKAMDKIGEALVSAFPDPEPGAENARPRKGAAAGTGRRS